MLPRMHTTYMVDVRREGLNTAQVVSATADNAFNYVNVAYNGILNKWGGVENKGGYERRKWNGDELALVRHPLITTDIRSKIA